MANANVIGSRLCELRDENGELSDKLQMLLI